MVDKQGERKRLDPFRSRALDPSWCQRHMVGLASAGVPMAVSKCSLPDIGKLHTWENPSLVRVAEMNTNTRGARRSTWRQASEEFRIGVETISSVEDSKLSGGLSDGSA